MKKKPKIKSSKHSLKFVNTNKRILLDEFLCEYSDAVRFFVSYLFNNRITYVVDDIERIFSVKEDLLDCPNYISTSDLQYDSSLSERAIKCAATQACGIVKSACSERKKLLYIRSKLIKEKKRTRNITAKLAKTKVIFPDLSVINAELNSICCSIEKPNTAEAFDFWITLKSIGKKYGKIVLPIKASEHSNKFASWEMKPSILVKSGCIDLRWEMPKIEPKTSGRIVGADTGLITCVTLSDSQVTGKNKHGQDLKSICDKVARKQKGSKGFKKAVQHRTNYINWSINQLNFTDIKQVNLENVSNFRYKKRTSKLLNSWTNTAIREKLIDTCNLYGVHVELQSSAYRSQRCSNCGFVCKSNRKGKGFSCKRCRFSTDADLNGSLNHEADLPSIPFGLRHLDNKNGFFWKEDGVFDLNGQEFTVLVTNKVNGL